MSDRIKRKGNHDWTTADSVCQKFFDVCVDIYLMTVGFGAMGSQLAVSAVITTKRPTEVFYSRSMVYIGPFNSPASCITAIKSV